MSDKISTKKEKEKKKKHEHVHYNSVYVEPGTRVAKVHCAIAEDIKGGKSLVPSMKEINAKRKHFSAVSTFSGCGGGSVGMKMASFDVLWANEFIPAAQDTYKANNPDTHLDCRDIRTVKASHIMKRCGLRKYELDLFEGSPPCKGFSTAGVQEEGWGKEVLYSDGVYQRVDDLFDHYTRLLKELQPKVFIAENVAGLIKGVSRGAFKAIFDDFTACGYKVKAALIEPVKLGIPQTRDRLIYIGVRKDIPFDPVFPSVQRDVVAVRDLLPNVVQIKTKLKGFMRYVPADRPSPTIVASDFDTGENASFSCGGWIEDDKGRRRKYNLAELRRLMTFPDDFLLTGSPRQQWERLGRSHAPLQVYHIAKALRDNVLVPYYKSKGSSYSDNIE
jgi:DNA (cytosine-5)-methyltransferase 1